MSQRLPSQTLDRRPAFAARAIHSATGIPLWCPRERAPTQRVPPRTEAVSSAVALWRQGTPRR